MPLPTPAVPAAWSREPSSDAEIARRVLAGEIALFEILMRRHNQKVYRAVRAILKDEAEVEDAMQQAYVSAYLNLAQFAGASQLSTWLVRIAVNEALGRLRRASRLSLVDSVDSHSGEPMSPLTSLDADPEQRAQSRELVALVELAVDSLPGIYRTVFVLREVEGLSTVEAAEALGVSEEVVKTRLHRAKAMVRDGVAAQMDSQAAGAFPFPATRCDRVVAAVLRELHALQEG